MTGDTSTKDSAAGPGVGLGWRQPRNWPGIGGGVILSWCPGSDPEMQLPAASPGKGGNCVWVGLSWLHLPGHSPALVGHEEHLISSCWAARWGPAEERGAGTSGPGWGG